MSPFLETQKSTYIKFGFPKSWGLEFGFFLDQNSFSSVSHLNNVYWLLC